VGESDPELDRGKSRFRAFVKVLLDMNRPESPQYFTLLPRETRADLKLTAHAGRSPSYPPFMFHRSN